MAKLKPDPVDEKVLVEFVDKHSDFGFELDVLHMLTGRGLECEHGGTYEDPQTKKVRQFDLRAALEMGAHCVRFAIECKQVGANFPLIIFRVPRPWKESFHEVLLSVDTGKMRLPGPQGVLPTSCINVKVAGKRSLYPSGESVGKSCAQVGVDTNGVSGTDSEMFAKWSQAISSAGELIDRAAYAGNKCKEGWLVSLVLPVVVVPHERLWVVDYDDTGQRKTNPNQVNRCSFFIGHQCGAGDKITGGVYTLTHLEFVTPSGLDSLIAEVADEHIHESYFAHRELRDLVS